MVFMPRLYPELRQVTRVAERRTILRKARRRCGNKPIVVAAALQMIVVTILFTRPLRGCFSTYVTIGGGRFDDIAASVIIAFVTVMIFVRVTNSITRKYIRKELASRGFSICVQCGYDLRGLIELRCPECGSRYDKTQARNV